MSGFYVIENYPSSAPESFPASGRKDDVVQTIVERALNGAGKLKKNLSFVGQVLYCTHMNESEFRDKFFPDFVRHVLPKTESAINSETSEIIVECIVYIPEVCAALPRPTGPSAKEFYDFLDNLKGKDALEKVKKEASQGKGMKNAANYIQMVERFPKVYGVAFAPTSNPKNSITTTMYGLGNTLVAVNFPYDYDMSLGVMTKTISGMV